MEYDLVWKIIGTLLRHFDLYTGILLEPFLNSKWPKPLDSVPNLDPPPKVEFDFMVFDYEERDRIIKIYGWGYLSAIRWKAENELKVISPLEGAGIIDVNVH